MAPHVKAYEQAVVHHKEAAAEPDLNTRLARRTETRDARDAASARLHAAAKEIGRHAGEFFPRRSEETGENHLHRLAVLHGGNNYGTTTIADGPTRVHFWDRQHSTQHAADLHKSLQHHYPHWKSELRDWAQGERHLPKSLVSFTPGQREWRQPTER